MPQEVITVTDPLALTVLQQAVEREKRLLRLSIAQTESKIAVFEAQFGARGRTDLFGKVDEMILIEWEGEEDTLGRLRPRLQRLEELRIESR